MCVCIHLRVWTQRLCVGIYTHRVHVCVCVYFRVDTQSSHVGMYIFHIRTEFMFVFIYLRTYTQGFHVCVCIHVDVRGVYILV